MSVFSAVPVQTTPGANHVFAPPEGWFGTNEDYLALMRKRWAEGGLVKHQMGFTARFVMNRSAMPESVIEGPYAEQAMTIITRIAKPI
ncbi:hypothetical protein [Marinobacter alkaliphilus]|uniref:Uncharacterized protein n=1 Tax=Marinobacter alkaliphilus TaxID=254719 RepID=A0ABZ3E9S0_9GAMM